MPVRPESAARRYADAIFELAQSEQRLDGWERDLNLLDQVFSSPGVSEQLGNPSTAAAKKDGFIDQYLSSASQEARNLARVLVGRVGISGDIEDFEDTGDGFGFSGVEAKQVAAKVGTLGDDGVDHAGNTNIQPEPGDSLHLIGDIEVANGAAEKSEVFRVL